MTKLVPLQPQTVYDKVLAASETFRFKLTKYDSYLKVTSMRKLAEQLQVWYSQWRNISKTNANGH